MSFDTVVIAGSMSHSRQMLEARDSLEVLKYNVILPKFIDHYATLDDESIHRESVKNKVNHDLIREYNDVIGSGDSLLVVNEEKNGIENYIGANTFQEITFAHLHRKPIFLKNPMPDFPYILDELKAMKPKVLYGDYESIRKYSRRFRKKSLV